MLEGRQALRTLLRANKRLSTARLPKDSFGQLWSYAHECGARRVFRELARIAQVGND
jgi:transposase